MREPRIDGESVGVAVLAIPPFQGQSVLGDDGAHTKRVPQAAKRVHGFDAIGRIEAEHSDGRSNRNPELVAKRAKERLKPRSPISYRAKTLVGGRNKRGEFRLDGLIERDIGHRPNRYPPGR